MQLNNYTELFTLFTLCAGAFAFSYILARLSSIIFSILFLIIIVLGVGFVASMTTDFNFQTMQAKTIFSYVGMFFKITFEYFGNIFEKIGLYGIIATVCGGALGLIHKK